MNLYLIGHDYRYAVEQMLLTLFPDERPEYPDGRPTGDRVELRMEVEATRSRADDRDNRDDAPTEDAKPSPTTEPTTP